MWDCGAGIVPDYALLNPGYALIPGCALSSPGLGKPLIQSQVLTDRENTMATVTFDTLKLVEKLKTAGFAPEQAEAVIRAIADAQDELVTKAYLDSTLAPIKTDLAILKWMMGILLAGVISLVMKSFF
jgi:hypothetical protein